MRSKREQIQNMVQDEYHAAYQSITKAWEAFVKSEHDKNFAAKKLTKKQHKYLDRIAKLSEELDQLWSGLEAEKIVFTGNRPYFKYVDRSYDHRASFSHYVEPVKVSPAKVMEFEQKKHEIALLKRASMIMVLTGAPKELRDMLSELPAKYAAITKDRSRLITSGDEDDPSGIVEVDVDKLVAKKDKQVQAAAKRAMAKVVEAVTMER